MTKDTVDAWDELFSNNTDIDGEPISNATRAIKVDDIFQRIMSQVAKWTGDDTIASASTTDLSSVPGMYVTVTGTVTITGLGTVRAGWYKIVRFSGALTLTHNATSLILPGGENIVTAAGDVFEFVSEGSGNWRCVGYVLASGKPIAASPWEVISQSTVTGASASYTNLGDYRTLRVFGWVQPATDAQNFEFRTSTNNGSSYDSAASDYKWQQSFSDSSGGAQSVGSSADDAIRLSPSGVGNASNEYIEIDLRIDQFNQTFSCFCTCTGSEINATGLMMPFTIAGQRNDTTARNAISLSFVSGTINSGYLTVVGIKS